MIRRLSLVVHLLLLVTAAANGQVLKVGLEVEEETAGLFESAFSSALRRLGDVEVVTSGERADYVLRVVVVCSEGDCKSTPSFSAAIELIEPASVYSVLAPIIQAKVDTATVRHIRLALENSRAAWAAISLYEKHHVLWSVHWGRNRYERAIAELVAEINAKCFERARLVLRFANVIGKDEGAAGAIADKLSSTEWLCS